jgi:hypothetical protein
MPINVCKNHSSKTLIGIYEEVANYNSNPVWRKKSQAMISLINEINKIFVTTQIWGLTSHDRLVLLTENKWDSRWHIIIENIGNNEYYFEYLIPDYKSPWKNGTTKGVASSIEEAIKYLGIAMRESEGWVGNSELNNLINSTN